LAASRRTTRASRWPPFDFVEGVTVTAILAGILAAVAPARRASRLDVPSALQYE
jgi:ABC-type lipoprotein release transport system permease subunit